MKSAQEETWFAANGHVFMNADSTDNPELKPGCDYTKEVGKFHAWEGDSVARGELAAQAPAMARWMLKIIEWDKQRTWDEEVPLEDFEEANAVLKAAGVLK